MAQAEVASDKQEEVADKMSASVKATAAGGKMKPSYKHIPHSQKPPHLVAKRNARERRRVQAVNQAFYKLRKSVPIENRNKRVSKVKTLQRAIDYIRKLELILAEDGTQPVAHESASSGVHSTVNSGPAAANISSCDQDQLANVESRQGGAKQRPTVKSGGLATGTVEMSKKAAAKVCASGVNQKLRRGRKPFGNNKEQLTGDLQRLGSVNSSSGSGNNNDAIDQAQTRDSLVQCPASAEAERHDASAAHSNGLTAPYSGAGVSYGRPRCTTTSLPLVGQHYPNHHYHCYMDDSEYHHHQNHRADFAAHPPLPANTGQQLAPASVELLSGTSASTNTISSSSTLLPAPSSSSSGAAAPAGVPNFSNYPQTTPIEYQYGTGPSGDCSAPRENCNQQPQHLILDRAPSIATSSEQDGYLSRQPAAIPMSAWQSTAFDDHHSTGVVLEQLAHNKRLTKTMVNGGRHLQLQGQAKPRQMGATAKLMPADSTSTAASVPRCHPAHGHLSGQPRKLLASINSPPISICSSSSLSPSTTLKSLDLSGGGSANTSGTSTTSSTITSSATDSTRSDKSPTTTTTSTGAPVVCRPPPAQRGSGHNSNHDAHSTTGRRDYHAGQQQVNNYGDRPSGYATLHTAYGPLTNGDYHRDDRQQQQQQQLDEHQRTAFKSIDGALAEASPNNGQEFHYRDGSRSSPMQQPLVGGSYLANNLHGNNRHGAQLFQQQQQQQHQVAPTTYYQQHQHQQQQLHHHHGQQPSSYQSQGQHFSANQHGPHQAAQHHSTNHHHLSDHRNQCHLPGELPPNTNTIGLITATNIIGHHHHHHHESQSLSEGLGVVNSPAASIATSNVHYTILPL